MKNLPQAANQQKIPIIGAVTFLILLNFGICNISLADSVALELVNTVFTGNTNGIFNPGGNFGLIATITAVNETASAASATLASSDSCVTITQGSFSYGSVSAGQNANNSNSPFEFSISSSCPAGHLINFTLTMAADGYFSSPIIIPVLVSIPSVPYITPPYTCVTNYYVSTNGSDSNSGTSVGQAWYSISHAISYLKGLGGPQGGVCVNVQPGTYNGYNYVSGLSGSSDTPTGYLVFRSMMLHGATIQIPAANASNPSDNDFRFDEEHFIVVDGFNLVGQVIPGSVESGVATNSYGTPGDHMKIINNILANHGGAGVSAVHTDYLVVEGNVVFGNANTSTYEVSGISTWQAVASDTLPGFHNIISDNIVFDNAEVSDGHSTHSDGNGIIIDDFRNTQNGSSYGAYAQQTLVENNLSFGNGGSGIHAYLSDHITMLNNTVYNNFWDTLNTGTWRGDINVINGMNNTIVNNIAYANPATNAHNTAYLDASTNSSNTNNVWANNLSFNGTAGQSSIQFSGTPSTFTSAQGNVLGKNPKFLDTSLNEFTLQTGSPAILAGTSAYGYPSNDLAGMTRSSSAIDTGAYQYSNASASLNISTTGNGFGMVFGSAGILSGLINCGVNISATQCSTVLNPNTTVTLIAAAASDSFFSGWNITGPSAGTCIGTTSPCNVTVTGNTSVETNFLPQTNILTASASSGGTISPSGAVSVNYGASQTFTVTPSPGYAASLMVDGATVTLTNNTYTLSDITTNHTIAATFALQNPPVVAITSPVSGTGFTIGSNVTITATASEVNGTINTVTFYNGPALLGTVTTGPYSYTLNNVAAGNYSFTAVATDAKGVSTTSIPVTVSAGEIIDNTDPNKVTITGAWTSSTSDAGYYGVNYIHDGNALKGTKSVNYTPSLARGPGSYQVYIRYTADTNRASNVPVDVIHAGVTTTVPVNEQTNGKKWVLLGTYNFLANGSGEGVTIRNTATNGFVIADAVEFI